MKDEDLIELGKDPRFIPGIYNYCDSWCERCAFTSRCSSYARRRATLDDDDPASYDPNDPKFIENLEEIFETTKELIRMGAAEDGIDLDSLRLDDDEWAEQERRREAAYEAPLIKFAERYAWMVKEWFDRENETIDRAYQQSFGTGNDLLPEELEDAVKVILWYQFMPAVKLFRVAHRDGEENEEWWINDSNGSAKVALIALDRSIIAWGRMRDFFPEKAGGITPIIAQLEELRNWAEREFPDARSFIRPGLDEITEHVM